MGKVKIIKFIGSDEYFKIVEEIGNFFKITWGNERMPKIINLTEDILRYNQTSETPVKELIKKWLNFLNENEINNLYQFLNENFLPKVSELWQEEETPESEEEVTKETFEEKERRYLELMKTMIKFPQSKQEKKIEEKKEKVEAKEKVEEYKTITFEPKDEHKKVTEEESLPETTIVITKKKEEEKPPEGDEFLDLSKL
jgi:hypothetical protein